MATSRPWGPMARLPSGTTRRAIGSPPPLTWLRGWSGLLVDLDGASGADRRLQHSPQAVDEARPTTGVLVAQRSGGVAAFDQHDLGAVGMVAELDGDRLRAFPC